MLVVFEGIDKSGKSTLARGLFDNLYRLGYKVVLTQQPSDELKYFFSHQKEKLDPLEEARLFYEDRKRHYEQTIKPCIDKGYIVVCDRSKYSSIVYQSQSDPDQDVADKFADAIIDMNSEFPEPDICFVVNRGLPEGLDESDYFESFQYLMRCASAYKALPKLLLDKNCGKIPHFYTVDNTGNVADANKACLTGFQLTRGLRAQRLVFKAE